MLFDSNTFSSVFQRQVKLLHSGIYTSHGLIFDHGLLHLDLDFHSISINSTTVPIKILDQFNHSSHPSLYEVKFPRPEEWTFEEGERVTVSSSEKEATIAKSLEVGLATNEGIEAVSWYNVWKVFSAGDFISVTSGPLRGMIGWVERIADDSIYLLEYKEKGNVSTSRDDIKVSFILIYTDPLVCLTAV